jgi:hypothetical protein
MLPSCPVRVGRALFEECRKVRVRRVAPGTHHSIGFGCEVAGSFGWWQDCWPHMPHDVVAIRCGGAPFTAVPPVAPFRARVRVPDIYSLECCGNNLNVWPACPEVNHASHLHGIPDFGMPGDENVDGDEVNKPTQTDHPGHLNRCFTRSKAHQLATGPIDVHRGGEWGGPPEDPTKRRCDGGNVRYETKTARPERCAGAGVRAAAGAGNAPTMAHSLQVRGFKPQIACWQQFPPGVAIAHHVRTAVCAGPMPAGHANPRHFRCGAGTDHPALACDRFLKTRFRH